MKSDALRKWELEVQHETDRQIENGEAPWVAATKAVDIVKQQRQRKALAGKEG